MGRVPQAHPLALTQSHRAIPSQGSTQWLTASLSHPWSQALCAQHCCLADLGPSQCKDQGNVKW